MGATRLASVIVQQLFSGVPFLFIFPTRLASVIVQQLFSGGFPFYFPDAGRVAPIRACVSSSTKRYH